MAKTVQHRRGTTAVVDAITPAVGELLVDTDRNDLRVGDGSTAGGIRIATKAVQDALIAAVQSNLDTHKANVANPHSVTKTQVGLSNVTNDAQLAIANNLSDVASAATSFNNIKQSATETTTGVVEKATAAEAAAGTDDVRFVTPKNVADYVSTNTQGGPSIGTNSIIRTNATNIIENIELSDHKTTFTVDTGTDTLDVGTDNGYADGDTVVLETTTTLPSPFAVETVYYVINATATTMQLSATFGGSAITITDTGTGTHTIYQNVNGITASPVTIETGFAVTIPYGSTWSIP